MISIKELNYKVSDTQILKNININIEENKIIAIIGPNGSGKTSLIKSIASLNKYNGEIKINNINLKKINNKERAKIVSYLPQHCLKTNINVKTLIRHGRYASMKLGDKLNEVDKKLIEESIEITGIKKIVNKNLMDISGGERQLAYLAMVLTQATPIVLLDEPTTFLDISHQIYLLNIIKKLKNEGKTIIIVLHDLIQALDIADEVILMEKGKIIEHTAKEKVTKNIKEVFHVSISSKNIDDEKSLYKKYLLKE